jgi:hypothetical protein
MVSESNLGLPIPEMGTLNSLIPVYGGFCIVSKRWDFDVEKSGWGGQVLAQYEVAISVCPAH